MLRAVLVRMLRDPERSSSSFGPSGGPPIAGLLVGTLVVVLAVLMFGLTTDSGAVDRVSVITAAAGFVMVGTGRFVAYRDGGDRTTT